MTVSRTDYGPRERFWLWLTALAGAVGINGAFLMGIATPGALAEAWANPIALAFIVEAFVLLGLLGYLLTKWGVARLSWPWLVALSLLGGLAFALPVVILWGRSGRGALDGPNDVT